MESTLYLRGLAALLITLGFFWLLYRAGENVTQPGSPAIDPGDGYTLVNETTPGGSYEGTRDGWAWFKLTPHKSLTLAEWKKSIPALGAIRMKVK